MLDGYEHLFKAGIYILSYNNPNSRIFFLSSIICNLFIQYPNRDQMYRAEYEQPAPHIFPESGL